MQPREAVGRVTAPEEPLELVEDMARQGSAHRRQRPAERGEAIEPRVDFATGFTF
jgi:hypothetical protein